MTGIAVFLFVKGGPLPSGQIHYFDIGDDLSEVQKLSIIRQEGSVSSISERSGFSLVAPSSDADWINQRDPSFDKYMEIGNKKSGADSKIFLDHTNGVKTQRDVWCYNTSRLRLREKMEKFINFYNSEVDRYARDGSGKDVDGFVNTDPKLTNWTRSLKRDLSRGKKADFSGGEVRTCAYRPFFYTPLYFSKQLNEEIGQIPRVFPKEDSQNALICVTGIGSQRGISVFMSCRLPDLQFIQNGQFFPLYLYEATQPEEGLFATEGAQAGLTRRDAITDVGLAHFQASYQGAAISKEDLFYYIYGLLHSPEYRTRFANNLAKQLPRIPAVKRYEDFAAFRDAGRALGHLHVNFETVDPYMVTFKEGNHALITGAQTNPQKFYRVTKMKFGGKGKDKDRSKVIYNDNITMQNIPLAAYDYVVNGKPALEWVMERQVVKTDKDSGIVNDANDYANETVGNPAYPLELFQRVITVSLRTMEIVRGLPKLEVT
jgi:predicted helicase